MKTEEIKYPCTFCGTNLPSKSARKRHNIGCVENKNRERNKQAGRLSTANNRYQKYGSKEGAIAAFECMADDLPDGAYFAMAEEFGLDVEDLI